MKLSFLAIVASVKATFIPGGITPKTGNRVHHMWTASDRMYKHPEDKPTPMDKNVSGYGSWRGFLNKLSSL